MSDEKAAEGWRRTVGMEDVLAEHPDWCGLDQHEYGCEGCGTSYGCPADKDAAHREHQDAALAAAGFGELNEAANDWTQEGGRMNDIPYEDLGKKTERIPPVPMPDPDSLRPDRMYDSTPLETPKKRRFKLHLLSPTPFGDRTVERDDVYFNEGWVIFSNGPEYSVRTDVVAYPAHRVNFVEELTDE